MTGDLHTFVCSKCKERYIYENLPHDTAADDFYESHVRNCPG